MRTSLRKSSKQLAGDISGAVKKRSSTSGDGGSQAREPPQSPRPRSPRPRSPRPSLQQDHAPLVEVKTQKPTSIEDFTVHGTLGQGGFGTVLLVEETATGEMRALKEISKRNMNSKEHWECVIAESEALQKLRHPLIIKFYDAFQDAAHIYFLLELADGGTLLQQLEKRGGRFSEEWSRFYCAEIALAISYVHSQNIVYRDMKLENLLVSNSGHVKLADFGLATQRTNRRQALCGTPHMLAPEVLLKRVVYGPSTDWWGVGMVLCEMLLGKSPLAWVKGPEDISSLPNTFKKKLHLPQWGTVQVSDDCRQCVEQFLAINPTQRLNCTSGIEEMQRHSFFASVDWSAMDRAECDAPLGSSSSEAPPPSRSNPDVEGEGGAGGEGGVRGSFNEGSGSFIANEAGWLKVTDAAVKGDIKELRRLFKSGVPVDATDYDERTALHAVCSSVEDGDLALRVARFLIEECGASVNALDRWGFTCLQDAARSGRKDLTAYLRRKGAHNGTAAFVDIFNAAASGDIALVRRLVESGSDPNEKDYDSRCALHVAASEGQLEVVQFLVDEAKAHHSPADRWGNTPFGNALFGGKEAVVEFLQSRGAAGAVKANVQRANNAFNFNEAAANGDLAELRRFVAAGAKVNEGDYDSRRAIHIAASEGKLEVVRFLVDEAGADHSVADRWGYTPLADANRAQQHAVADFLRMRGAEDREEEERPVVRSRGGAGLNSGMFKGLCRLNALSDHCSLGPHSSLLFGRRLFPRREERRRAKEKDARPARVCFPSRGAWCDSPGRVTGARFLTGVPSERRAFQRSDGGGRRLHLRPVRHRGYVNSIAVNSIAVNRLHLRPRRYRGVARQARARLADDRRGDGELRPHPEPRRRRSPAPPSSARHPCESLTHQVG